MAENQEFAIFGTKFVSKPVEFPSGPVESASDIRKRLDKPAKKQVPWENSQLRREKQPLERGEILNEDEEIGEGDADGEADDSVPTASRRTSSTSNATSSSSAKKWKAATAAEDGVAPKKKQEEQEEPEKDPGQ